MVGEKIRAGCRQVAYPVVGLVVSRKEAVKPLYSATFFSLTTMTTKISKKKENRINSK